MNGERLGERYKLLRLLGQGGMGAVHEAEDTVTGARVAIKVISDRLLGGDRDTVRRFRREAKAAAAIDSPHIVRVLDSGQDAETGELYIVMELLEGEDLKRLIERVGPLPPDVAMRIAAQALSGLVEAHRARIIHRDIKPANLFIARKGDGEVAVKLLDFGIAKIKAEPTEPVATTGLTTTGNFLGSPLYVSPEQVDSSKDVDEQTDVWSLGASIYCALTGAAPHQNISAVVKLIFAICSTPAPPIRERAPWVPSDVAKVVHGALQIAQADRYPSAAAMLEAVNALLPDGDALREEMLVGLSESERAAVGPAIPLELDVTEPAPRKGEAPAPERPNASSAAPAETHAAPAPSKDLAERNPTTQRSPRNRAPVVAAALAIAVAAAFVARPWLTPTAQPTSTIETEGASSSAPRPTSAGAEARTVALQVAPEGASVEVDGAPLVAQAGTVSIAGKLGSVHHVRVFDGKNEVTRDVIIAENGAVPAKVALEIAADGASKPAPLPEPALPAQVRPAKPSAPPAPAAPSLLPVATQAPKSPPSKPEDVLMPTD